MGANYTAGDLNVSILGDSIHAEKGIDNIIRKLNSLQKALTVFNTVNAQSIGTNLSQAFTQISNAVNSIDSSVSAKFQELGNASASFRTFINAMNRVGKIDATKIATNLTSIFTALSTSVNSIDNGTIAKLQQIGNASQGLTALSRLGYAGTGGSGKGGGGKGKRSGFGLYSILRFTYVIYLARRLGNIVGDILKKGADYVETLNLWETAMKDNVSQATEFVNKMNEAYGISKKTLMNAQAVFKNMIGTLGGVSEEISYKLSEGITQMAVDYASLFNVNFEQAFIRFQSALAGQVRPIRSIAGFDITENTLFELYKTLGGTKTVRQLTITEKRLLAIYAIFKQMQSSGAIGDLKKTMDSFANQSRVMAEAWQEMWSYAGLIITHLIEQSGLMTKINGLLIFFGNVLEAVADNMGAIKSFGVSIFEDTENSAYNASNAVDELKGKLLDFDKFRVMNSNEENEVVLDETILNAIAGYDTILQNAKLSAQEFAKYLGEASGLFDKNGVFQPQRWNEITASIGDTVKVLGVVLLVVTAITNLVGFIIGVIGAVITASENLTNTLSTIIDIIVMLLNQLLSPFGKKLENIWDLFKGIGDILSWLLVLLSPVLILVEAVVKIVTTLIEVIKSLFTGFEDFASKMDNLWNNWDTIKTFETNQGFNAIYARSNYYKKTIDTESELVKPLNFSGNGGLNNIGTSQMKSAFYQALVEYGKTQNNSQPIVVTIDGQEVFYATRKVANQNGLDFSNVR